MAIDPKREEQMTLTLLITYLALCVLSLVTFVLWATRDASFRAATEFPRPDWRTENFWGVGTAQVFAWFYRRWVDLTHFAVWCRQRVSNVKEVAPDGWRAMFAVSLNAPVCMCRLQLTEI